MKRKHQVVTCWIALFFGSFSLLLSLPVNDSGLRQLGYLVTLFLSGIFENTSSHPNYRMECPVDWIVLTSHPKPGTIVGQDLTQSYLGTRHLL